MNCNLQAVTYVLKNCSLGRGRVELEDLAVHTSNRQKTGTSPKHCRWLYRKVLGDPEQVGEGLQARLRKRGICVGPEPADPLQRARRTNELVQKTAQGQLAPVALKASPGTLAKSNLFHMLWTSKCGMGSTRPNTSDAELELALQEGMRMERPSLKALRDRRERS